MVMTGGGGVAAGRAGEWLARIIGTGYSNDLQ